MFKWKYVAKDLGLTRNYIGIAAFLFIAFIFVGMTNDQLSTFLTTQIESLSNIAQRLDNSSNPTLMYILFIFFNNAIKCAMVIFFGAFFGLYPLFFITLNGLMIGFVLKLAQDGLLQYSLFDTIVKGLLPHGILELPALVIAAAYGLRLGKLLFSTIAALVTDHQKLETIGLKYKETLKSCGVMTVYLTITLAIAAIIESTLTVWLLSM